MFGSICKLNEMLLSIWNNISSVCFFSKYYSFTTSDQEIISGELQSLLLLPLISLEDSFLQTHVLRRPLITGRLKVQADNGQTIHKNITLTHNLQQPA